MIDGKADDSAHIQEKSLLLYDRDSKLHCNHLYDKKRNFWAYFDLCGGIECSPIARVFLEVAKQSCGYMRFLSSLMRYLHGKPRSLYGNPIACGSDFQRTASPPNGNRHKLREDLRRFRFHGIRNT